jgi:cytosine/adenosine deaminase-related metal-dependent hydrolase
MTEKKDFWILNGTLFTQDSCRHVIKANIRIAEGRIAQITKNSPRQTSKKVKILNADGKFILPGFVQTHLHRRMISI